ncbi:MAG TPA: hypothetical protein VHX20_13575 [Terracidiphilus sp.]|jgi:hypothetical protein|nr:hypothetical protein [Terracidiphilus sp.]
MTLLTKTGWEIAGGLATVAATAAVAAWMALRKRPSADELELARRQLLVQSGRLVDGMLLDICSVDAADGRTLTMLLFSYRIGGVDYECSQDITMLSDVVDPTGVRAGFPCTVRYQPGNPQNSLVVAEGWSGLREGLPHLRIFEGPGQRSLSYGNLTRGTSSREIVTREIQPRARPSRS